MNEKLRNQLLAIIGEEANIDVEIDQELFPKPEWAIDQIIRSSGVIENICEHFIGHPSPEYLAIYDPTGEKGLGIHSCDFCCADEETKERIKKEIKDKHDK